MPSIALWLADGRCLTDDEIARLTCRLGASEQARHARFLLPQRRRQFVIGRMLLRLAVSRLTGCPAALIGITERQNNAPQLLLPSHARLSQPYFSLSHSRHWVACAVSLDTPVGVDIEWRDMQRDVLAISHMAFEPVEHAWLERQPDRQRMECFYRLWSLKEALYKLFFCIESRVALPPLIAASGEFAMQGEHWHGFILPHAECGLALCSALPGPDIVTFAASALLRHELDFLR